MEKNIWVLEGEEVVGGWRKMHNEEIHNFFSLPNIIWANKSRTVR
jgi:hypothetical protein